MDARRRKWQERGVQNIPSVTSWFVDIYERFCDVIFEQVWRVEDGELVDVDKRALGVFFGGDSYVIKYSYEVKNKPQYIIYFWQVRYGFSLRSLYFSIILRALLRFLGSSQ